jgi:hypothetical protein
MENGARAISNLRLRRVTALNADPLHRLTGFI